MSFERWRPRTDYTRQEQVLRRRLTRTGKLFGFLRDCRRELFSDEFQAELEAMYRDTGAGREPVPPAVLAMAILLQAYEGASDAEAVELTVVDLRWQMVLDRLGCDGPAFGQGTLVAFRDRLIRTEMDRRLLERTVELARQTKAFDFKKLPKTLRVAIDSSPLEGAGRVEDTINLLGHAARKVAQCAADLLGWSIERVAKEAGIPVLLEPSVKKALDLEWSAPDAKAEAINILVEQLDSLDEWLRDKLPAEMKRPPLQDHVDTLAQIRAQDLEPDPSGGGRTRIRHGVAPDRRVSIEDSEMRHGRKSKTKLFHGYKRHIGLDLDTLLLVACAVTPANRPEEEAAPALKADIDRQERAIAALYIDRGYIASPVVNDVLDGGGEIICKPWVPRNGDLFSKADFKINLRDRTITCPAGEVEPIDLGADVEFNADACDRCEMRDQCTTAAPGHGRTVTIADSEFLQQRLRKLTKTRAGRARVRARVSVEHSLAHLGRRQGRRARYRGVRKNLFDVRRTAAVQNLETVHRRLGVTEAGLRRAA
ncbi:MAG: IS1182 family transposase [Kofleriaceae bacterium]|nr:IS1182 family transposase [Kofleriaceae bacterium]MBE7451908.1 IS1182 family transposase [Kofleriaceae bacterium]